MVALFLTTYGAVFLAEIVGDKLLYTTGVLATRYRAFAIMLGVTAAFMGKMAVAVAIGTAISRLPRLLVAAITTASFVGVAFTLWRKPVRRKVRKDEHLGKGALVSFATVFFSEWGDVGQITAATMAARFSSPLVVWLGAVGAMATKGALAASVGSKLREWLQGHLSPRVVRYGSVSLLLLLGVLSVIETLTEGHA